jgi:hypothetical protein
MRAIISPTGSLIRENPGDLNHSLCSDHRRVGGARFCLKSV